MSSTAPLDVPPYGDLDGRWPTPHAAFRPRRWQLVTAAVIFAGLLLDVAMDGSLRALDHHVSAALLDVGVREHPAWSGVGFVLSQAGGRGTNLAWICVLCAVILLQRRTLAPLAKALSASAIMVVAVYPFKEFLSRSYPADPRGDYLHAPGALGGAFPSGHQANATLLASIGAWIAMEYVRSAWVRRVVGAYAIAAPVVSAIAVLLMGYHWLTDVVAGTCAGILLLALVRWLWSTPWGLRAERALGFRTG
ncbi:phosphatase PAP2 family protein [Cumulibacter manganitolerans]|uniref:phosphatase PAP2 family protein n=1 Tax=Cumulibacter manganitolerans TaxID=1884992 RepID=UPI001295E926|nr:phosphatase PAP2 family protein [Cumulibacter manganitolerans]